MSFKPKMQLGVILYIVMHGWEIKHERRINIEPKYPFAALPIMYPVGIEPTIDSPELEVTLHYTTIRRWR